MTKLRPPERSAAGICKRVVVISTSRDLFSAIRDSLQAMTVLDCPAEIAVDGHLELVGFQPQALVFAARSLNAWIVPNSVSAVQRRWPLVPLILCTEFTADNLQHLKHFVVDDVIALDKIRSDLAISINRTHDQVCVERYVRQLETSTLRPLISRSAAVALKARPPKSTIAGLARSLRCNESTLRKAWRPVECSCGVGLSAFLRSIQVLNVAAQYEASASIAHACRSSGIDRRTVQRCIRDISDSEPDTVCVSMRHALLWFEENVLYRILAACAPQQVPTLTADGMGKRSRALLDWRR